MNSCNAQSDLWVSKEQVLSNVHHVNTEEGIGSAYKEENSPCGPRCSNLCMYIAAIKLSTC